MHLIEIFYTLKTSLVAESIFTKVISFSFYFYHFYECFLIEILLPTFLNVYIKTQNVFLIEFIRFFT